MKGTLALDFFWPFLAQALVGSSVGFLIYSFGFISWAVDVNVR